MADKGKKKDKKDKLMEAAEKPGSRAQRLGAVLMGAKKQYGHSIVHKASRTEALIVPRAKTGVFGLDLRTGGGLPLRRVSMLYGPANGAKTTTLLRSLGNAQQLCANCCRPGEFEEGVIVLPNMETGAEEEVETQVIKSCPCGNPNDYLALWVDAEGVWEPQWAIRNGVWAEKVLLVRPSYGEQGYDLSVAMIHSGEIDLIVIDSIAAMIPKVEFEASMEQSLQGPAARMNNRFFRKIVGGMNLRFQKYGRTPSLWLTNQYREKIGVLFGSPEVLPGGKGQEFSTSVEIECRPGSINKDKETGEITDRGFRYNVKKNKVTGSQGSGEYKMCMFDTDVFKVGDVFDHEEVIHFGVELGFIDRPSQSTYEFNGEKFRGRGQLVLHFVEHQEEYNFLKEEILKAKLHYRDDNDD